MTSTLQRLTDNLAQVRERIATAAARSGRRPTDVVLVAVTKFAPPPIVVALANAGATDLGESRPQELWGKAPALAGSSIRWHFIGHLQRNKIARTLPLVSLLHSADSRRLLEAVDAEAAKLGRPSRVLLEINISGEAAKHGFSPEEIEPLLPRLAELQNIRIEGLMGMASLAGGLKAAARDFAALAALRERLSRNCPTSVSLAQLSMGMSGDYELAIEHGATMVRVGSALFEGVDFQAWSA